MRDKLICMIQNAVDGCSSYWAWLIADYLIAHGVTVQKWIPVSERLPEDSGLTLVRVDFSMWDKKVNVPSLERYVNEEKAWFCDGAKLTNITHWMPLPAAPKEVE